MTASRPAAPARPIPKPKVPPIHSPAGLRPITPTQEFRILRLRQTRHVSIEARQRDWAAIGVAGVAAVLSIAACVRFYLADQLLGYHDSFSHLEISRRVLTGRTTGIAQLGTIWLPLPHLLQAPFAWNSTLYLTGLAGAIVSMTAFVASATLIYRIVRVFSPQRAWPAIAAAAVFMTNANMLYHQSTAMDELPFYAFALAATYALVRWADTKDAAYLLRAAIASLAAMLCRYEAWFLAAVLTICVLIMARQAGHSWRDTRGLTGLFAAFGALAASVGWTLYNVAITGSPVNFLYGPNSSADQMAKRHGDVEIGSWSKTLRAYSGAVVADLGIAVLAAAAVGLLIFLVAERLAARSLPILALSTIIPFYIVTIEAGQEPIGVPPVNPYLLNLRFGLVAALPAALFIGYALARIPRRFALASCALVVVGLTVVSAQTFRQHDLVTVQEATGDLVDQKWQAEAGEFLQRHTTGPILLNLVRNERVAFPVLDRVIYEGTKAGGTNIWATALRDPHAVGAHIILMRNSSQRGADDVYVALHDKPAMAGYHVIFKNVEYTVYELGT